MFNFIRRRLYEKKHPLGSEIIGNGFIFFKKNEIINNNLGDDLNIPLLESLTEKKYRLLSSTYNSQHEHLLCIGSIIESYTSQHSIIWGSGAIEGSKPLAIHPKKICAVRGPLTRKYLLNQGIPCPEIYGDPAQLMPYIYNRPQTKKYEYGFIPHYIDNDLPSVQEFKAKHPEILFIKFHNYNSWQHVIDQINSCQNIISSSLHGLILSDAYNIPNVRISLSNKIVGGDFKFHDYFLGVGRECVPSIDCQTKIQFSQIIQELTQYTPTNFDPKPLLWSFPYSLSKKFQDLAKCPINDALHK